MKVVIIGKTGSPPRLSVVGAGRNTENSYSCANSGHGESELRPVIPFSIVRTTTFFESIRSIADAATEGNTVHLVPVLIQPTAVGDVAAAIAIIAAQSPLNGCIDVAGTQQSRLDELIRFALQASRDPRVVVANPHARYFGADWSERTLLPRLVRDWGGRVSQNG